MPSPTYALFRRAIFEEKQVVFDFGGHRREVCPVVLGLGRKGEEKVLAFQFGGAGSRPLPPGGEWRCFTLDKVGNARLRDGPWREGGSHQSVQSCVAEVDLDINIHVRRRR
jgi:hypothetical protein